MPTLVSHAAEQCARAIVDRVGPDIRVATPIGIGKPVLLLNALYRLAQAEPQIKLSIFTGLTLTRPAYGSDLERRFAEPLLDRVLGNYPEPLYVAALRANALPANITVNEFFLQAGIWLRNGTMQRSYTSLNYSHVARHLQRVGTNVFAQLVAPDPSGAERVSFSSNTDVTLDMLPYVAARRREKQPVVVACETNGNLPYMPGEAEIAQGELDVLLTPQDSYDLFAPPKEPVSLVDYAMALHAATLIKDGGTLQIGIGSFSDALSHALILRHTRNEDFRALLHRLGTSLHPEAELTPFDSGLYGCTEMLVDGYLALHRAGILKRRVVGPDGRMALLHAGFFVGNARFYRELREMPPEQRAEIAMTAISYTNALDGNSGRKRAERVHARFVNTAMTATLLGSVSSDATDEQRVVSGVGGQLDLVTLAHQLDGARSIIAVRSTRRARRQTASNVVWSYANATVPRSLRDIIVTEYGVADLRGKSDRDCIVAMLGVADDGFQDALLRAGQKAGKIERDFVLGEKRNALAHIEDALMPARRDGLLPEFPLGSDMTETEQALLHPLLMLKSADYGTLLRIGAAGLREGGGEKAEAAALERLGLAKPANFSEHAWRILVRGALRAKP